MSLSLKIKYRRGAFDLDVALDTPAGVTALFGPSGAGKTTIVKAVAGLIEPDAGQITVHGATLFDTETKQNLPTYRRQLGYVFQDARLFPHLTVRSNLRYGARARRVPIDETHEAYIQEMLGIADLLDRRPGTLSGGEKQRVALARTLLSQPRLLMLDEPLSGLDDARKEEILPYLERVRDSAKIPILYVSHSVREVARLATSVALLDQGKLIGYGPVAEMFASLDHASAFSVQDLGAVLDGVVQKHHSDGLTELSTAAGAFLLPKLHAPPESQVRLRIKASDVMLARERPKDISALNIVEGVISQIRRGTGPGALVQITCGEAKLVARITQRSADVLQLKENMPVFAVVKSVSVARGDIGT